MQYPSRLPRRAGTAAIAALAAAAWIAPAMAQTAPSPGLAPMSPGQSAPMAAPMVGHMGSMGGQMGGGHHGAHMHGSRGLGGLFFQREDKALTTADVQKIAEAFLLWHGERNWRITEAKEAANNTVEFAVATAEGSVVARVSVDRKTGRPRRIG